MMSPKLYQLFRGKLCKPIESLTNYVFVSTEDIPEIFVIYVRTLPPPKWGLGGVPLWVCSRRQITIGRWLFQARGQGKFFRFFRLPETTL